MSTLIRNEHVESLILQVRGQKVLLDRDLALLYEVETKALNRAVSRNIQRFPDDFVFQLTGAEKEQVVASRPHLSPLKFSKALPHAFTEHGAIMAASVLNSPRAVEASIFVVRAFIKLREMLASHKQLAVKLDELEARLDGHDNAIHQIISAIRTLAAPLKERKSRRLGFKRPEAPVLKQEKSK